jgi:hypothetical protein
MMLRQIEFGVCLEVAVEASGWVFTRIDNELPTPSANIDVLASGSVTGFATSFIGKFRVCEINAAMSAGGKITGNIGVAIITGRISDVRSAGHLDWSHNGAGQRGTGNDEQTG